MIQFKTLQDLLDEHATTVPNGIERLTTFTESGNVYVRFGRNGSVKFTPVIDGLKRDDLRIEGVRADAIAALLKKEGLL